MIKASLLLSGVLLISNAAIAASSTVIAKYGNWFHQDDDLYAQCLVVSNGQNAQVEYIFQGLAAVTTDTKPLPAAQLAVLEKLRRPLPADSKLASYQGYNFLQIEEAATPSVVILGQAPAVDATQYDQYFNVSPSSDAAKLVRSICDID